MTIEDIKKLLRNYKINLMKLSEIKERYETLKEKLISPQAQALSDMPRSETYNKNKIIDGISNLEQLDLRMAKQQKEIMKDIYEIEDAINTLTCNRLKQVIELRYFKSLQWESIGLKMYCDKRTAQRLHGQALKEIQANIKK